MRKKYIVSLMLCLCVPTMIFGCQSTPVKENIINKTDFLETLSESPLQAYIAPNNVQSSEIIHGLKIDFDATVNIPETDVFSVIEVEKKYYSTDDLSVIMNYFESNAQWVARPEETKSDIQYRLYRIENSDRFEEYEKEEYKKALTTEIDSAPDSVALENYDLAKNLEQAVPNTAWCLHDNRPDSSFIIGIGANSFQYLRDKSSSILQEDFLDADAIEKDDFGILPNITKTEALAIAQKALDDLNVDTSLKPLYCKEAIAYQYREPVSIGWQFAFTRTCNALQTQFDFNGFMTWAGSPEPVHAAPWDLEVVLIFVDEDGIYKFDLRGAGNQTQVLFQNVELLPFSEILEKIKNQLVYQHAYQDEDVEEYSILITSINLECSLIDVKDHPDIGTLVPTWNIGYQYYVKYTNEQSGTVTELHTLLNAIDGSYIEPRATEDMLGY